MQKPTSDSRSLPPIRALEGHGSPITRRDFLGRGLISGAAMVAVPTWLSSLMAPRSASAQQVCGLTPGAGKIPFVGFDLSGGASIAGSNVMVGGPGGQLDFLSEDGYRKLGLPADMLPQLVDQLDTQLGLAFHADSGFLRGIIARTSPETRAKVNGTILCARSENDTGNNPHNPIYGISRAGADGDLVTLIGTSSSLTGGTSTAPMAMIDPSVRPTKVDRASDSTGLVDTGKLVQMLSPADAGSVMDAMEAISELKLERMQEDAALEQQIRCNYRSSAELVVQYGDPDVLNPLSDADLVGATGIFADVDMNSRDLEKTASVLKLVVNGFAGAGTIELGGYDYHDGTRATGERRDFAAGEAIGATLEYAARRNRQVLVYVFSDGSVSSSGETDDSQDGRGKGVWRSDDSSTAAAFLLAYDPTDRPALTRPNAQQIGYFRSNGSLETGATRVSNAVSLLSESIVLNYLALHDELDRFEDVLPDHGLGSGADLDALVAFQPIRS